MKTSNLKKALISILACFMIVNCNQSYAGTRIVTTGFNTQNDETDCVVLDEEAQILEKVDDETLYLNSTNENEVLLSNTEVQSSAENLLLTVNTNKNSLVNLNSNRMMNLNLDWKFYFGDTSNAGNKTFDDSSWSNVNVPHDFSITQHFSHTSADAESGYLPGGTGWYRKTFVLPSEQAGKTIILDFDGVYRDAYVYVNGTKVGEHHFGYSNFAFDVSNLLVCDDVTENVISVKVVNNAPTSRWYSGSGIYRDVNLIITDKVHVDYNGTMITTPEITSGSGKVNAVIDVVNDSNEDKTVIVKNTVYTSSKTKASTTVVSENVNIDANSKESVTLTNNVDNPNLWSVNNPNLYYVETEITDANGNILDTYDTAFGFRYFGYSSSGMTLNGEKIKLNGVCLHHDQGAAGSAAYYDAMYRQLVIMKDMGVNAIRTSHNPVDKQFIQICDEIGLLVIEEVFDGLVDPKNSNSNDFSVYFETEVGKNNNLYNSTSTMYYSEYATRSIVKRDRNSPSIFAWSFGNEIQEGTGWANVSRYADICENFITWVNSLDTTRIVTSGDNNRGGNQDLVNVINTITNAGGIAGFNYANSTDTLSNLASRFGGDYQCIIASETSSHINSRGIYTSQASASDADGKYHLTSYDTSSVGWGITAHDSIYNTYKSDNVLGEFVWTGFDYIGEPTPWNGTYVGDTKGNGATPNSSYFGIVDTAGFAKDSYYLYRSQWNKSDTTLHLVTAWDSDNYMLRNEKTPVWIYSNAPIVKLYKDGNHIGTATRTVVRTTAGYEYYTYTTESVNPSVCEAVSPGNDADSLYSVFNVAYDAGTISAKAFNENNEEISVASGNTSVSTPGTVTKLDVKYNRDVLKANGQDLLYIEVDVEDENGNLDTTATNNITFTLRGEGEIVGVDNGDQATLSKYQNSNVLDDDRKSANINAYAGKALVIVKSTDTAGSIKVDVSSSGLTGGSVNATTTQVLEVTPSYTYTKNYSTIHGTDITLDTTITKTVGDTLVNGTIVWDNYSQINEVGSHSINGMATFEDDTKKIVACNLHIIDNVVVMKNISTAVGPNLMPQLPSNLKGYVADGSESTFDFNVQWDEINASMFKNVGDIVEIEGIATILGNITKPVKAYVRVAELINENSFNVGPQASVSQDITGSDNLNSVNNGVVSPGDNTNERWSNYENRTVSPYATLTFSWATAQAISDIDIEYYYDNTSSKPENVEIKYSLNGIDFVPIGHTETSISTYNRGATYNYELEKVINPVAISITFTQKGGQASSAYCVAVTEVEFNTFAGAVRYNSSPNLSSILVNGTAIDGFNAETLEYNVSNVNIISATSADNASITVLPVNNGVTKIVTVSEDGSSTKTYSLLHSDVCIHTNTTIINQSNATCISTGNTGDTYCNDCKQIIETGTTTEALGHDYSRWVITTKPTYESTGVKTHYCLRCDSSYEEELGMLKKVPTLANLTLGTESDGAHRILVQGQLNDFANLNSYYTIKDHGFIYYSSARLGTRNLTMNTIGKYKTSNIGYGNDENNNPNGTFSTYIDPSFNNLNSDDLTKYDSEYYTIRAYATYEDSYGNIVHVYSDAVKASYNSVLAATQ